MTDWSKMPPGPQMDAAAAERVMGWQRGKGYDRMYWTVPDGHRMHLIDDAEPRYSGDIPDRGWQPSQGDIAAAFQVMGVRDEWRWTIDESDERFLMVELFCKPGSTNPVERLAFVHWDEPGTDGDRAKAWCVGICRAALMAVEAQ